MWVERTLWIRDKPPRIRPGGPGPAAAGHPTVAPDKVKRVLFTSIMKAKGAHTLPCRHTATGHTHTQAHLHSHTHSLYSRAPLKAPSLERRHALPWRGPRECPLVGPLHQICARYTNSPGLCKRPTCLCGGGRCSFGRQRHRVGCCRGGGEVNLVEGQANTSRT